ncbi:EPIDERMAL PATTERNING FACTOR-like protein 2 [Malania oleifera]|uniref:EPIDERMAL PATTERNING FACTOR-like protein 2 n=1 Tax=Malania oleifera TaxID=397392 RepID=UPI0025ADB6D3|nr:EPIDERMAL PATTERNING FACTOR-like protein 2 [Malania oleifera]
MGCTQKFVFCRRNPHLIISLLFLLLSSPTQFFSFAEGRVIPKLQVETPHVGERDDVNISVSYYLKRREEEKVVVVGRAVIGSRPPSCDRIRCSSCGHCEAIQVPVVPQVLKTTTPHFSAPHHHHRQCPTTTTPTTTVIAHYYSRRDISNYKPLSWKCKCGNFIFNP